MNRAQRFASKGCTWPDYGKMGRRSIFKNSSKNNVKMLLVSGNEGLPRLCADCKILISLILIKFSLSISDLTALYWIGGGGDFYNHF